ncbi:MAG TPA: LamG domain-containing protein [Kofleriaceae bacterium]|nr:LamG domain-containing protein [Kofleriaceae bacterium]
MRALAVVVVAACGRTGFDARSDATPRDAPPDGLPAGLVAWYPMDTFDGTTLVDATGNGHGASCTPPACPTLVTPGRVGNALAFDGVDDHLVVDGPASVFGSPFTVAWWESITGTLASSQCPMSKVYGTTTDNSWQLVTSDATNQPGATLDYITAGQTPSSFTGMEPATFDSSAWHHVAMTWDGTNRVLWVDGALLGGDAPSGAAQFDDGPIVIGADIDDGTMLECPLSGRLDDLRIYDRALDASEIHVLAMP